MTDFEAFQYAELKQENTRLRELAQTLVDAIYSGRQLLQEQRELDHAFMMRRALSQAKAQGIVPKEG